MEQPGSGEALQEAGFRVRQTAESVARDGVAYGMYLEGATYSEIAAAVPLADGSRVRRVVEREAARRGVPAPRRRPRDWVESKPERDVDLLSARASGSTWREVAERFGLSVAGARSAAARASARGTRPWPPEDVGLALERLLAVAEEGEMELDEMTLVRRRLYDGIRQLDMIRRGLSSRS